MKLTNAQIFESIPVLAQAEEKGMLGFAIARNRRVLAAEVQEYARKRDELLEQFGTKEEDGKFTLTAQAADAFYKALEPFAQLEVEVAAMQVTPEVFCGGELTSSQMYTLNWMVKEETA